MDGGQGSSWRRGIAGWWCLVAGVAAGAIPAAGVAEGQAPEPDPAAFSMVLQRIVLGDLVMAGGSNVAPADARPSAADVDDGGAPRCVERTDRYSRASATTTRARRRSTCLWGRPCWRPASTSASVGPSRGPLRARLAGPGDLIPLELVRIDPRPVRRRTECRRPPSSDLGRHRAGPPARWRHLHRRRHHQ